MAHNGLKLRHFYYILQNRLMDIIESVKNYWGWVGIDPIKVIAENEFGNLILKDSTGKFWRLCPEDVYCDVIADSDAQYNELVKDEEFNQDWFNEVTLQMAVNKFGPLKEDNKFTLAVPADLGGEYKASNLKMVPFERVIQFFGDLAKEIHDAEDGTKIKVSSII